MDYEQKYKELVEKLQTAKEKHGGYTFASVIDTILLELKESEDERIRKEIIAVFKGKISYTSEEDAKKYIAWLEKQDEKKSVSTEETPDYNNDFNEAVSQKIRNMVSKLFSGDDNVTSKAFADHFAWELLQLAKAQVRKEQKSWSEEDERMLGKCIDAASGYYSLEDKQNIKDWLRAIKDRIQPQPKQEWSEDDEKKRQLLIKVLEVNHPNTHFKVNPINTTNMEAMSSKELVDWLKSLKPRWKPTEEQMEALTIAVHDSHEHCYYRNLYSLYNDLKSL